MSARREIRPGDRIGLWTVLDQKVSAPRSSYKWLCRCQCGTERFVNEQSLKNGSSQSCGCTRTNAVRAACSHQLIGKVFGDLTVTEAAPPPPGGTGSWWRCVCSCGNTYLCPGTLLVTGRRTHCGCKSSRGAEAVDIRGQRFGMLTALEHTQKRDRKGYVIWRCQCDCGNIVERSVNDLKFTNIQSCGCKRKAHDQILGSLQARVSGTSIDIIKSNKLPSDNTSGAKGVYLVRGRYVAKISFQKKSYYLGTFDSFQDAKAARLKAEEELYGPVLEYYRRWQAAAEADPQWAVNHPVQISVSRQEDAFHISFLPALENISV